MTKPLLIPTLALLVAGCSAPATPPLRALADQRGLLIGAAVEPALLVEDPDYPKVLAREFNLVVAENVMKWGALQPTQGRFNFPLADLLVEFAQKHNQAIRGHTLVWHQALPGWVYQLNPDQLATALENHIRTVVGRYKGRIAYWDVVNEAIGDDARPRPTPFNALPDYLERAFRLARQADPQAKLFYNDYGAEGLGPKSDAIYALVRSLKQKNLIDGIGFQAHLDSYFSPQQVRMAENLERFAQLGLEIHITEMDVRLVGNVAREIKLQNQARVYQEVLQVCLRQPRCKAFTLWGFTDLYSWITASEPLIFDDEYRPKPAYFALQRTLQQP